VFAGFLLGMATGPTIQRWVNLKTQTSSSGSVTIPNPIREPGSAHEALSKVARELDYYAYLDEVEVPYGTFPAAQLSKWKRVSEEERHLNAGNGIFRISVDFNHEGDEIYGVDIQWRGGSSTSFPYRLGKSETIDFTMKAIREMEDARPAAAAARKNTK
jgi:hypothetical protein